MKKTNSIKRLFLYLSIAFLAIAGCGKESEDCHFFITINNNSSKEVFLAKFRPYLDISICGLGVNLEEGIINPFQSIKYRPYSNPDCIETRVKFEGRLEALFIVDSDNYDPNAEAFPCEEFEERTRNTILRTYVLTLEDLERLNYTINYPEDASIGVD